MKAGFALSVCLLTSGSWATAPNPASAAPLGEADREVGADVDHLFHRAPPAADLSDAAKRVLGHPKITVVPKAFVRETPPAGAFERFLGNDKALAVIDFGVQTVGAPPGTVQAMASLVLWLMEADRVTVELTPDQQALLHLAQFNVGRHCGSYLTLASLQNTQDIDPTASDAEVFCKLLLNGAVLAREYAQPVKR